MCLDIRDSIPFSWLIIFIPNFVSFNLCLSKMSKTLSNLNIFFVHTAYKILKMNVKTWYDTTNNHWGSGCYFHWFIDGKRIMNKSIADFTNFQKSLRNIRNWRLSYHHTNEWIEGKNRIEVNITNIIASIVIYQIICKHHVYSVSLSLISRKIPKKICLFIILFIVGITVVNSLPPRTRLCYIDANSNDFASSHLSTIPSFY